MGVTGYTKAKMDQLLTALTVSIAGKQDKATLGVDIAADANVRAALGSVASIVTAAGALVVQKHNPIDATAAPLTMSLPTGQPQGTQVSVEKTDTSVNAVTVTGNIRGTGSSTLTLLYQYETLELRADSSGSWWPLAGHRTKTSLDAATLALGKTAFTPMVPGFSKRRLSLETRVSAPFDILTLGDSLFAGPQGVSSQRARWPMRMMDRLRARLPVPSVPGGFGYIPCTTPSWTLTGNQSSSTTFGLSRQGRSLGADTGSGVGTAAITIPVSTSFTLVMQRGSTDTFTITVDGGAPTAIPLATSGLWTWNSGQLTRGTHTISIARTAGVPTVLGVMTFDGDETSGIRIWDGAQSGSRADSFNAADGGNSSWADNIGTVVNPSLVLIEWMTNDAAATTGRTPAQYQTTLGNILALVRSKTAAPILWVAPYQRMGGIQAPWDQYVNAMKAVAATDAESSFVDMRDYTPQLTYPDTYGALADSLHPTDKYASFLGTVLADHIIGRWAG